MTKLRDGYDPGMVHTFLDKVTHTLTRLEAGKITGIGGAALVAPADVERQRFPVTKFRDGYEMNEVDDFLDEVTYTLTEYVQRATRGALQPLEAATGDSSAISVPAAHENLVSGLSSTPATESLASYDPLGTSGSAAAAAVATAAAASAAASASTDQAVTGSSPAPSGAPHPDALSGDGFMRKLQSTRASMFGAARESVTFRGPDGRAFSAVDVERTDDGLIVHLG